MSATETTQSATDARGAHSLQRMVRRLVAWLHVHRWEETLWNAWGIDVEQRCRCGQYRHHLFVNRRGFSEEPDWQPGKHPNRHMAKPPNAPHEIELETKLFKAWAEAVYADLRRKEALEAWKACATRLRAFAIHYSDHPKRNHDDKLAEVLAEYDQLCGANAEVSDDAH